MNDDILFDMGRKRVRAKKEDVLRDLKAFGKLNAGRKLTATGYKKWDGKRYSLDTLVRLFGSFSAACEEANLEFKKKKSYTDKELIEYFENVWRWRGQKLVRTDLLEYNKEKGTNVHPDNFARKWGWNEFVLLFAQYKLEQITFEELIARKKQKNAREPISPRLRAEILQRDNYRCADCGASATTNKDIKLEVHHLKPVSKGGKTEPENLITNCHLCNSGKSDKILNLVD